MDRRRVARDLHDLALASGFDRAGVAALGPAATGPAFLRWLEDGCAAGMTYMARRPERRLDSRTLLPGARTALCVAQRYAPNPSRENELTDLWRGVARYARGDDYHDTMGKRLVELAAAIERRFPGARALWYVDTGPILERELAAKAGLGAVGKNTQLLHPEDGSWFLLGEVLTTLEAEPALPISDLCGQCRRCLDACPTGALAEPFRLDANRCISYWTIEHRGSIPEEIRARFGSWAFGCDICQEVCPWNSRATPPGRSEFELPEARRELDLVGLLAMGPDGFANRLQGSALTRPKLAGLRRNAAVALGNLGGAGARPALERAATDDDELVREHAAWALDRLERLDRREH